jgi:DNA-binding transcriptional ArsR family regulator
MVKYEEQPLSVVFAALSHHTRRVILTNLKQQTLSVSQLAAPFKLSLPAISKHLKILERAKLIRRQKKGREIIISLDTKPLVIASKYLSFYNL